jgi:hypothetical protein
VTDPARLLAREGAQDPTEVSTMKIEMVGVVTDGDFRHHVETIEVQACLEDEPRYIDGRIFQAGGVWLNNCGGPLIVGVPDKDQAKRLMKSLEGQNVRVTIEVVE